MRAGGCIISGRLGASYEMRRRTCFDQGISPDFAKSPVARDYTKLTSCATFLKSVKWGNRKKKRIRAHEFLLCNCLQAVFLRRGAPEKLPDAAGTCTRGEFSNTSLLANCPKDCGQHIDRSGKPKKIFFFETAETNGQQPKYT